MKKEIERFVRKDGVEIDDEEIFNEMLNSDDNLSLIALEEDEEYKGNYFF